MNKFNQTISYLESFIPKNHHFGKTMDLSRIKKLCQLLGNPQTKYPIIHIGGTSGKGSTATFTAEILKICGLKVGLHISPHLQSITERFQINGRQISFRDFVNLIQKLKPIIYKIQCLEPQNTPTYFEILVAAAFYYFYQQSVDAAVIEVGLGGKLDATNIIPPSAVILTNVSLDHTLILGNTVTKIFNDKSQIIKPHAPFVVSGLTQPRLRQQLSKMCLRLNVPLYLLNRNFKIKNIKLSLCGEFQKVNFTLAQVAAKKFINYYFPRKSKNISHSITMAAKSAFIPGRFEIISQKPLVILDGAHNKAKMNALVKSLKKLYPNQKFITVFAVKKDKPYKVMLNLLNPLTKQYILTQFTTTIDTGKFLALDPHEIAQQTTKPYLIDKNPFTAIQKSLQFAAEENLPIVVTGSLYLVGEARNIFWSKHFINSKP